MTCSIVCHIVIFFIYSFKCHCVCGFAEISPAWQIVEIAWTKATDCLKFQINIVSVAGNGVADVMIKRKWRSMKIHYISVPEGCPTCKLWNNNNKKIICDILKWSSEEKKKKHAHKKIFGWYESTVLLSRASAVDDYIL